MGTRIAEVQGMIEQFQIREKISRYLRDEISLDQFEDWLVQRSWNMHRDSDEGAQKLASAVELRLAEHSSGHLDEPALRNELLSLVTRFTCELMFGEAPRRITEMPSQNRIAMAGPQFITFPVKLDQSVPQFQEFRASVPVDTSRATVVG